MFKTVDAPLIRFNDKMKNLTSLSTFQINRFFEEGYVIVPDVFNPVDLEPLRKSLHVAAAKKIDELKTAGDLENAHEELCFDKQLAAIYGDSKKNGEAVLNYLEGLRGGGFHSREMFDLIAHPKLISAVRGLLGTTEVVASSAYRIRPKLPKIGRGNIPWHQDSGYFAEHCDTEMIVTCWIPLVDANLENGCMQILPRMHKTSILRHHTGGNAGLLVIKEEDLPDDPCKAITAACPRGGVVFMTNRTPHCSTPNTSEQIRWSTDLRFQSAEVPSNREVQPQSWNASGKADSTFYKDIAVACYPPEADFLVSSEQHPEKVVDFSAYVKRREDYDRATINLKKKRTWPALVSNSDI